MLPFDQQMAVVLNDEADFRETSFTAEPVPSNGRFRTVWQCQNGTYVTHIHSWSTGMGYMAKVKAYADRFGQGLPEWARPMPPIVVWRLCDVALRVEQPLPIACPQPENAAPTFSRTTAIADGAVRFTAV